MPPPDPADPLVAVWRTSHRTTAYLLERLPAPLWDLAVPGAPRRTVGVIAGHLHNARCVWITMLGRADRIAAPARVDLRRVSRRRLLAALERSSRGIERLLEAAVARGRVPAIPWLNLEPDPLHFLAYFVAHEAHHRGQIVLLARGAGRRLSREVTVGLWQWRARARESRA
jgi:uncharacterized damage-inducible protein DinB